MTYFLNTSFKRNCKATNETHINLVSFEAYFNLRTIPSTIKFRSLTSRGYISLKLDL